MCVCVSESERVREEVKEGDGDRERMVIMGLLPTEQRRVPEEEEGDRSGEDHTAILSPTKAEQPPADPLQVAEGEEVR